jgi:hypothetical protein
MSSRNHHPSHDGDISCLACLTNAHPEMVPWTQHAIGCPVRAAELVVYTVSHLAGEARDGAVVKPLVVVA